MSGNDVADVLEALWMEDIWVLEILFGLLVPGGH